MKINLIAEIINAIKYRFNLDDDKAAENHVVENIKKAIEFRGTNLWTLIFAIFIASIGLNVNSTAVIIGAMLISPLMGPIMGLGLGSAIYDIDLIKKSAKNLLFATIVALFTSCIYFLISPLHEAKSELLARTNPTIWDVLIALFGGLTGIIANSRKNMSNAIPGVAIATALMPPLCTAGYGLAIGNFSFLFGAFYLYLINCFFIGISTYLIIRFLKFKHVLLIDQKSSGKIRKAVLAITFVLILPTVYFAYLMVKQELFLKNANEFINKEIISDSLFILTKKIDPIKEKIDLLVYGNTSKEKDIELLISKKENYKLGKASITIENSRPEEKLNQQAYSALAEDVYSNNKTTIKKKDSIINILYKEQSRQAFLKVDEKNIQQEFNVLFCKTHQFSITKALVFNNELAITDTLVLLYIKPITHNNLPTSKIESWLKMRTKTKAAKIVIQK